MNELRERIADVIGEDMSRDTELWHPEAKYARADRILALIADAMLSKKAVKPVEDAIENYHMGYEEGYSYLQEARVAVTTALAATGITHEGASE